MGKKTHYMAFMMDPEAKRELEDKAHEVRVTQGEVIRRALALYYATTTAAPAQEETEEEAV